MADIPKDPFVPLSTLLAPWPDKPLASISKFDTLAKQGTLAQVTEAAGWIESQQVCSVIIRHHGHAGLQRVLKGIAQACSLRRVAMPPRVRAVAEFYELAVY